MGGAEVGACCRGPAGGQGPHTKDCVFRYSTGIAVWISKKIMIHFVSRRGALCASLLVTCLSAGAASALSFSFTFSGPGAPTSPATVTGIVDGLLDNLPNQTAGLSITITSATNTPPGGWPVFTYIYGDGFDVFGGQVTTVHQTWADDADLSNPNGGPEFPSYLSLFTLGQSQLTSPSRGVTNEDCGLFNQACTGWTGGSSTGLVFTPVSDAAAAPGPLPIFGAAAAFGFSRKLRKHIKSIGNPVSSSYTL